MSTPWGLDADGHPKTAHEAAHDRIEEAIRTYIDGHLRTAGATGLDEKTIDQIRHLHLAEPWLPASKALESLEQDGLLSYEFDPARHRL